MDGKEVGRMLTELEDILTSGQSISSIYHKKMVRELFDGVKHANTKEVLDTYYSPENFDPENLRDGELEMIFLTTGVNVDF